jgi:thiosulfate/3-mercaptopyruvate sulfurtransferase
MNRDRILIEAGELLTKVDDANLRLFDTTILFFRSQADPTAYEQYLAGHLPGAAFLDHEALSDPDSDYGYTIPPEAKLFAQIGALGISTESEVVLYAAGLLPCATRAWWILRYAGHDNVRVLNGGLAAWQQAGGRLEPGPRSYPPAVFSGRLRPQMLASKEEVLAAMQNAAVRTVNTLPHQSYDETHIVGSTCLPAFDLMEAMESFLPDEALAARLKEEAAHKRIITYCGGGIAATVNAVAHLMAGNENVAVYDGSLSEWVGEGLPTSGTGAGQWSMWSPKRSRKP